MNNYVRTAIVVALFMALKAIYSFATRITQPEVLGYIKSIDNCVKGTNAKFIYFCEFLQFNRGLLNKAENERQNLIAEISRNHDLVDQVAELKETEIFKNVKQTALRLIEAQEKALKHELRLTIHELIPIPLKYEEKLRWKGKLPCIIKELVKDSITPLIITRCTEIENNLKGSEMKYQQAKSSLYKEYNIIMFGD